MLILNFIQITPQRHHSKHDFPFPDFLHIFKLTIVTFGGLNYQNLIRNFKKVSQHLLFFPVLRLYYLYSSHPPFDFPKTLTCGSTNPQEISLPHL